jgi:hypothetical protein
MGGLRLDLELEAWCVSMRMELELECFHGG